MSLRHWCEAHEVRCDGKAARCVRYRVVRTPSSPRWSGHGFGAPGASITRSGATLDGCRVGNCNTVRIFIIIYKQLFQLLYLPSSAASRSFISGPLPGSRRSHSFDRSASTAATPAIPTVPAATAIRQRRLTSSQPEVAPSAAVAAGCCNSFYYSLLVGLGSYH